MDNGAGWLLWLDPRKPGKKVDWPVAQGLGLRVVSDPTVTAGTFRLGLVTGDKKGGKP